jgi:serine/threonine protein kinase
VADQHILDLGIEGISNAQHVGSGGAADVYRADQPRLGRVVAVKILRANTSDQSRARFEREAQTLGRLSNHPGIVTLHEAGLTRNGQPFLMMEYCPKGTLADRTAHEGAIGWQEASRIVADVAVVVDQAHQAGVLHRDLKPANILIDNAGRHLIADFGVAALSDTGNFSAAADFTPGFAPPETLRGEPATPAGDVYSLGATAHALMTGRVPFEATETANNNVLAWIRRIDNDSPEDMRPLGVPAGVAAMVERAMAKDPALRPSISELADQFSAAADGLFFGEADSPGPADVGNPRTTSVSSVLPQKPNVIRPPVPEASTQPTDQRPAQPVATSVPSNVGDPLTTPVAPILPQKPTSQRRPAPATIDPATTVVPAVLPTGPTTLDRPGVTTIIREGRSKILLAALAGLALLIAGLGAFAASSILGGGSDETAANSTASTAATSTVPTTAAPVAAAPAATTTIVPSTTVPVPVVVQASFAISDGEIVLQGWVPDRSTAARVLEAARTLYDDNQIDDRLEIDSTAESVLLTLEGQLASDDRLDQLLAVFEEIAVVDVDEQVDIVATTAPPTTRRPATTRRPVTTKAPPATAAPTTAQPTTAQPTTAQPTPAHPTTAQPTTTQPPIGTATTNSPLG